MARRSFRRRRRRGRRAAATRSTGEVMPGTRRAPEDRIDFADHHLTRATNSDESLRRYVTLIWVLCACMLLLISAVAIAFYFTGFPAWALLILALGGTGATTATIIAKYRSVHGNEPAELAGNGTADDSRPPPTIPDAE